jgi:hypothetical protein
MPAQVEFDEDLDEDDEFQNVNLSSYVEWCLERHVAWRAIKIKASDDLYAKFGILNNQSSCHQSGQKACVPYLTPQQCIC